jgi:predicted Zn-dependent peptidase
MHGISAAELTGLLHSLFAYKHQVIYYGPLPLSSVTAQLRKWHRPPPRAFKAIPTATHFYKVIQNRNLVLFTDYDLVQSEVEWVRNATVYNSENDAVIRLFNNYFSDGPGSIVFRTIRESRALAYDTYASYDAPSQKGDRYSAVAYVACGTDKLKDAIQSMNGLLNDIPLSEELLETAKKNVKQDIETERITRDDILFSYLSVRKMGLRNDIRKQIYARIDRLGLTDIKHFHY